MKVYIKVYELAMKIRYIEVNNKVESDFRYISYYGKQIEINR